jgi:phasin
MTARRIHAALQQEVTMAATDRFDVPPEMRAFAEKSVEQARQAFDGFITAARHAVTTFEGQAESTRRGARDVTEKAMTFAERNIASSFDFAQQLLHARDVQDVLRLQAEYIKRQMQVFGEQAKELGESATKAAKDAPGPKR